MKYLHLIWAALFRRKTRTILTLVSIIAAFLLFGMLDAVRTSFDQAGKSANGAERLQTGSKLSFIQTLPSSLESPIAQVPGVKAVAYANWFGGAYQDPHNQVFSFAVSPNYLDLYPEIEVSAEQRKAFDDTRTGVLVGEELAQKYHWKVGDKMPLQSTIFPTQDGSKNWSFDIVGILHPKDKKSGGMFDQLILLHWKYFDETTPYNQRHGGLVRHPRHRREPGRPRGQGDRRDLGQLRPRDPHADRAGCDGELDQAAGRHRPDRRLDHGRGVLHPAAAVRQHDDAGGARAHVRTGGAEDDRLLQRAACWRWCWPNRCCCCCSAAWSGWAGHRADSRRQRAAAAACRLPSARDRAAGCSALA